MTDQPLPPTGDEPSLGGAHSTDNRRLEPSLGGEAALTHLIDAVHAEEPDIRFRAVEQLEAVGSDRAVDLLERATNDPNISVRGRAVRALGRLQHGRAVDILLDKLQTEPEVHVRTRVLQALGETGSERAVDPLIQILHNDATPWEHRDAALALGQIGEPRAVAALARVLRYSYTMRRAAGRAIGQIGEKHPDAVQPVIDQLLVDLFGAYASEKRYLAINSLSFIRPTSVVPQLIEAMKDPEREIHQRLAAISALEVIGDKRASTPLLEVFADTQIDRLRRPTAQALIVIRDPKAIPVLIDLLKHETWQVRRFAARILSRRGARSAVPHLVKLLEDSRAQVRKEAADALYRLYRAEHISQAIEPLARALTDRVPSVGMAASRTLDRIRQRDSEHARAVSQAYDALNPY